MSLGWKRCGILVGPSLTIGTGVLGLVWRKTSRRPVQCRTTAGRDGTSRDGGGEGAETGGESGFFLEYCFVGEKKWEMHGRVISDQLMWRPLPLMVCFWVYLFTCRLLPATAHQHLLLVITVVYLEHLLLLHVPLVSCFCFWNILSGDIGTIKARTISSPPRMQSCKF